MVVTRNKLEKEIIINPRVLGYELDSKQNVLANYLIPSLVGCFLYIVNFACDFTVAYRHFYESNPVWGALSIFFMYLPILGCYVLTISAWELWPEFDGCGASNIKWVMIKTLQHMFFPVWSMWRYAEKIFWSIEGLRCVDDSEREEIVKTLNSSRIIELYYFLQAYLQAAPQILLQLHILMRQVHEMEKGTVDAQTLSIAFSLIQMAKVTSLYQRFKSQKLSGKNYPWFKSNKILESQADSAVVRRSTVVYRCRPSVRNSQGFTITNISQKQSAAEDNQQHEGLTFKKNDVDCVNPMRRLERRRSSDFYEQPLVNYLETKREESDLTRETSVVDGPARLVLRENDVDEPDLFNPIRVLEVKGLPDDDNAGKVISFLWWFCFLLARMLAISSFAYFYPTDIVWVLSCHFLIIIALLLYDIRRNDVERGKAMFFLFIGFVYLFCLIEFKIKFKKVRFVYNLFFILTFTENFVMVFIWWCSNLEDVTNDWWFKYTFYLIMGCSILSLLSMLMYIKIFKPSKVVVDVIPIK